MARVRRSSRRAKKSRKIGKKAQPSIPVFHEIPYSKANYILMLIALIIGVLGFVLLALGDDNVATIAIVVGYVILMPVALYYDLSKFTKKAKSEEETE